MSIQQTMPGVEWVQLVSQETSSIFTFDKLGIGTNNPGVKLHTSKLDLERVLFAVDEDGVGIGTTANGYKLNVDWWC